MDPETEEYLTAVLWAAAVAWAVWSWVPFALVCAIGMGYENGGTDDPAAVEPDDTDPEYARAYSTLRSLGYDPLGPGFMCLWFHGWRWTLRTRVAAFANRPARRFAFVQRYAPPFDGYSQVYFATCWDGGRLQLTTAGVAPLAFRGEDDAIDAHVTENVRELERLHREAAAKLAAGGWRPDSDTSLDNLLAATRESARRRRGAEGRALRPTFAVLFGLYLGAVALAAWFAPWPWLPPVVSIAVVAALRAASANGMAEEVRTRKLRAAADRAREPHTSTTGAR